jgi:hypothetical protein
MRHADHVAPSILKNLAITLPTSGGRSVGIVRSRTQTMNFSTVPIESLAHDSGMCRIRLSEGISEYQQLKKKSSATALNTVLASAHIQMA